jgi:carboxypeptidase Taq
LKTLETLKELTSFLLEIQHISSAAAVLSWDQETYMPPGGAEARADQLATLQGIAHQQFISPKMENLLSQWIDLKTGALLENADEAWDLQSKALLRETWRDYSKAKKLPLDFVKRMEKETSLALQVWVEAREKNNYSLFKSHLSTIIKLKKEESDYRGYTESPYDALLDTYEPGTKASQIAPLFDSLKKSILPLLEKVRQAAHPPKDEILFVSYQPDRQLEFGHKVLKAMGYDFSRGRQDLSHHPFTTSFHPTDVRITTRIFEKGLPSALFGSIHEGGHALYDQGLDPKFFGTPLGEFLSLGIHESQSRLWENCVGRSKSFWKFFFPYLQNTFPDQLSKIDLQTFYGAINLIKPSLIRVEADELTYNLHILLRFEIEKEVIEGNLEVNEIPSAWNSRMKTYLGIVPEKESEGPLQDIHWAHGSFGYFPTYTLGNLYSVQFFNQAKKELPDLLDQIEKGNLLPLKKWLNQKIHCWGRTFPTEELVRRVTGEPLNPSYFIRYLEEKVKEIYHD